MTYSEKLQDENWQARRKEILLLDRHRCRLCGAKDHLQVHHLVYIIGAEPWKYPDEFLITLCEFCHYEEEKFKKLIGTIIPELTAVGISCKEIYDLLLKLKSDNV